MRKKVQQGKHGVFRHSAVDVDLCLKIVKLLEKQ